MRFNFSRARHENERERDFDFPMMSIGRIAVWWLCQFVLWRNQIDLFERFFRISSHSLVVPLSVVAIEKKNLILLRWNDSACAWDFFTWYAIHFSVCGICFVAQLTIRPKKSRASERDGVHESRSHGDRTHYLRTNDICLSSEILYFKEWIKLLVLERTVLMWITRSIVFINKNSQTGE